MHIQEDYPNLWKVVEQIASMSPFQKKSVLRLCENGSERYLSFGEGLVRRMVEVVDRQDAYEYIAKMYLWYTKTIRVEEMYFAKEGRYRFSEFDEVYDRVYGRNDYMIDYVVGLGMTQIFWMNHWQIVCFFLDQYIPQVKDGVKGAEVGVGHGLFHSELLRGCPGMNTKMLDISPSSLQMTQRMIKATGLDLRRVEPVLCDVQKTIPVDDGSLDALLMGELIEHIQEGEKVMSGMAKKMKPGGFCFFTTAANSPAEDHILLFNGVKEIHDFVGRCGWKIVKEHFGTLKNMTVEEAEAGGHNINYAAVLTVE